MSISSTAALLDALHQFRLLEPAQVQELRRRVGQSASPRTVAHQLIQQGSLTPFQVNQLFQGQGQKLLLGGYVLLERLGEGGMGEVFKAKDCQGQVVAVKVMRKERLNNPISVKRFRREARAAAKLSHPHVVQAQKSEEIGEAHVFVMEYVEGTDLSKLVKSTGPLPVPTACEYIRQAALGLQHAYEQGMVHRDIKPHNLLLIKPRTQGPGTVKILDFGLARLIHADESESTSLVTQEGAVLGTPDYIAPEQTLGSHDVDIRADLYSLGCTFYYLLTAQVPFPGGNLGSKLLRHQTQEPQPVEQLRPEVPARIAAAIRKLMAKKPGDRVQTPAELVALLSPSHKKVLAVLAGVVGFAALVALLTLLMGRLFPQGVPAPSQTRGKATQPAKPMSNPGVMKPVLIPGLPSSGLGKDGAPLPDGAVDPHWIIRTGPGGAQSASAYIVKSGWPIGAAWLPNSKVSRWIGPQADGSVGVAVGDYIYRTTIDLTGFEPAGCLLSLKVAVDNQLKDVLLNGKSLQLKAGGYKQFATLNISTGFVAGPNTLEFVVYNEPGDTKNPSGLRVELSGTARPLPPK
jgi:serine/threonine-protein kinase